MFGGWQEVWRHPSAATQTAMEFSIYLPPAAEAGAAPAGPDLALRADLHMGQLHREGRRAASRGRTRTDPRRARHQPARHRSAGRARGLRLRLRRRLLRRCHRARRGRAITAWTPTSPRAAGAHRRHLPGGSRPRRASSATPWAATARYARLQAARRYRSLSAFAPIVAPASVPWGQNAFRRYLGADAARWRAL